MDYIVTENGELYHYGVKGMKWGVRRYQNKDGSLTPAGRKKVSKMYKKQAVKVSTELSKQSTKMYVDAYNKAADKMNSGGIDKFNKQQEKKYGKDYAKRDEYMEDYSAMFSKELEKTYNEGLANFYKTNKNYRKAQELCKKYDMTSWDELAKSNADAIGTLRSYMNNN